MAKIGVLLVDGQPGVLSDIVRDVLSADQSVDLMGCVTSIADCVDAAARGDCDAVVWMLPDGVEAVAPERLLRRHPAMRIVAVERTGRYGSLWRMRPHHTRLGELSPERIISELHDAAR